MFQSVSEIGHLPAPPRVDLIFVAIDVSLSEGVFV